MARILAVEPDPAQAAVLAPVIERAGAEPVMADSKEAAIAALDARTPDLILVSALLSPRDESELADHLRVREGVDHVQILTIPLLAVGDRPEPTRSSGGFLSSFRRKRTTKPAPTGCDPERYGDELKGYLKLAVEARAEREAQAAREERTRQRLNRASEAGGTSEASEAQGASEAGRASEADQANTELIGAWDPVPDTPFVTPTALGPIDQDAAPVWHSTHQEPAGSYDQTLEPMVEPVAALDVASSEAVEAEAPGVDVAQPALLHALAEMPPDVEHSIEAPAAAAVETDLVTVGPGDAESETEPAFELTPPGGALDSQAAVPEWGLDVIEHSAYPADMAPGLDFESPIEPETMPDARLAPPASLLAPPALLALPGPPAPLARASMPSLEFALGPDALDNTKDRGSIAPSDDDRFSLSSSSFEVDRRESDDYLLAAASDAFHGARPVPAAGFSTSASPVRPLAPAAAFDIEESAGTADAGPAVEIWQALPEWVESCPPLEAHMEHAPVRVGPARPAQLGLDESSANQEAPAPLPPPPPVSTPPPVDARWLATTLDALRSDIQLLRTQAGGTRAADSVANQPPVLAEDKQASQPVVAVAQPGAARAPVPALPPPVVETPRKKARKPKPVEDEWGMFDPSQAGVEALLAALDAKAEQEDTEEEDEPGEPSAAVDAEPVPSSPRPRLAPLSMWVHTGDDQRDVKAAPSREPNDLRALLDGLAVPTQVANVSYPTGCRIRRVRMVRNSGGRRKSGDADEPVIILSRRALGRGSAGKDDQGPPTAY